MKFNLGDQVKIKSNGVVGIIIARGYNEYLDENDKQQSFEEYQIEAEKYYQCNEDEIELITIGQALQSIYDIPPQIKINLDKIKEITSINDDCKKKIKNVKVEDYENNNDPVNHPSHYTDGSIEVMDYIEDKGFNFALGNAVKYISRAGRKDADKTIQDLEKASWYLNREIERLRNLQGDK